MAGCTAPSDQALTDRSAAYCLSSTAATAVVEAAAALDLIEAWSTVHRIETNGNAYSSVREWAANPDGGFARACGSIAPVSAPVTQPWQTLVLGPIVGALCAMLGGVTAGQIAFHRDATQQADRALVKARGDFRTAAASYLGALAAGAAPIGWADVLRATVELELAVEGIPLVDVRSRKTAILKDIADFRAAAAPGAIGADAASLMHDIQSCTALSRQIAAKVIILRHNLLSRLVENGA